MFRNRDTFKDASLVLARPPAGRTGLPDELDNTFQVFFVFEFFGICLYELESKQARLDWIDCPCSHDCHSRLDEYYFSLIRFSRPLLSRQDRRRTSARNRRKEIASEREIELGHSRRDCESDKTRALIEHPQSLFSF